MHQSRMGIICGATLVVLLACSPVKGEEQHAIALHGQPKYGADFTHFDYTNPDAPRGGTIVQATVGSFNTLNPFVLKGVEAAGLTYLYETLMQASGDEAFSQYGLIARSITLGKDGAYADFTLRSQAHFHDDSPIRADDVIFSFQTLTTKGHPFYQSYFRQIDRVEKLHDLKVRFYFKDHDNRELPFIIGTGLPILSKTWWEKRDFKSAILTPPLGSGPYTIAAIDKGRSITYQRADNYWGQDLALNRGRYNFDTIRFEYFRDNTVALEAFKAGEFDLRLENQAKAWAKQYVFDAAQDGRVIVEEIRHQMPVGMQGFVFNRRRLLFKDRRVRQALSLVYDFEWANRNLFHQVYTRSTSYFNNSQLAAKGLPSPKERALLKPFQDQLVPEILTQNYAVPIQKSADDLRRNRRQAWHLLSQAGWQIQQGRLIKDGQPFVMEILLRNPQFERVAAPYIRNLEKLGITATIRILQDDSQYQKRLEKFDFDLVVGIFPVTLSPGNEMLDYWGSSSAQIQGSRNIAGIQDPVIDALINQVLIAQTRHDLVHATRALDRVLLWGHYMVPHWHTSVFRIAWWNKFSRPNQLPPYTFTIDNWWYDKAKAVNLESIDGFRSNNRYGLWGLAVITGLGVFIYRRRRSKTEEELL